MAASGLSAPLFSTHAYAASKGAINSLSLAVAAHYAHDNIRVNVIAPSLIATPMSRRAQQDPRYSITFMIGSRWQVAR